MAGSENTPVTADSQNFLEARDSTTASPKDPSDGGGGAWGVRNR